jgi:hypothetical protein
MTACSSRFSVLSVLAATCFGARAGPRRTLAHTGANPAAVGAARLLVGAALAETPS